jgi:hypothetical protein
MNGGAKIQCQEFQRKYVSFNNKVLTCLPAKIGHWIFA